MVESSISISIKNVKDYVHVFMSDQIEAAHAKISSYSALYADAMSAALTAKTLSEHYCTSSTFALVSELHPVMKVVGSCILLSALENLPLDALGFQ